MANPYELYDLLQDYAAGMEAVRSIVIGLVWTYCEAESVGLAMSPGIPTRTLSWAGSLRGKPLTELAAWVREFDPYRATVGMAAVNAGINRLRCQPDGICLEPRAGANNNLAVFEHFLPQLRGRRVVVVGRYPGLDQFAVAHGLDVAVLERQTNEFDLPDTACEYVLPEAEWVFITATSIPNKTFPRLAELSRNAVTVLMGPTTPWLAEFHHFGIDYLAGVDVLDVEGLRQTLSEGGGVRIFDGAVRYRVMALGLEQSKAWARQLIAGTVQERERLKQDLETRLGPGSVHRLPELARLEVVDRRLSRLDTCFKRLWDQQPDGDPLGLRTNGSAAAYEPPAVVPEDMRRPADT